MFLDKVGYYFNETCQIIGKKAKRESQNAHFLPPDTHTYILCVSEGYAHVRTCAYQGVRNVLFSENLAYLFSCNTLFEIHPFALLPTICLFMNVKAESLKKKYRSMTALSVLKFTTFTLALTALHTIWRGLVTIDTILAFN